MVGRENSFIGSNPILTDQQTYMHPHEFDKLLMFYTSVVSLK